MATPLEEDMTTVRDHDVRRVVEQQSWRPEPPSADQIAALFLLTFKEQYKLTQTAINVGAINGIVDSVCSTIQRQVESSLENGSDISESFHYGDPFASLQTEYHTAKKNLFFWQ